MARAVRVLGPSDLRLVWRDSFLLLVLVILPIACWAMRWIVPYAGTLLSQWVDGVDLSDYYGLITAYMLGQQPVLIGFITGILFIEERDEGTLLALQASPLSLASFLGYRLIAGMVISTVFTGLGLSLMGLVSVSPIELVAAAALASLAVPIVALAYAIFLENKLQAVAGAKLVQGWAGLPIFLFFVPSPWQWIGSLALPIYYPMRLFASAADGQAEWWLLLPGLLTMGGASAWLLRRLRRSVYL